MSFKDRIESGFVELVPSDPSRARSIYASSKNALQTALEIELKPHTSKTIFRELYEALRELCEAIGYMQGYKFSSHQSINYFIADHLGEYSFSQKFDRYRKLRNGINYYGRSLSEETLVNAKIEIPMIFARLEQHADI
ncbi:MAG: hypothetical protein ACOCU6_00615 [Nanoarchaeota archaeon]